MYNPINFRLAALFAALVLTATAASARPTEGLVLPVSASEMTTDQWSDFSDRLVDAITSENEGIRLSALRLSVQYSANVDIDDALVEIMRIYRNHDDDNVRRLAVVTLGSMNSSLAKGYLALSRQHEKSPAVKRTIHAVLAGIADGSH